MVYSKWTNIRYACLHPLLHLLEVLCRCDFGQFGKGIFKSIRADKTNFRIGICADKTDARQLYQKIIMQFYKKQTSVWKDKIERSEAVCSTLWILSEWQSNFIFHSLLPFIKAFVLTKSMSENFVFHQKHTSVWKHNWNVWRSVLKNSNFLRLSISQSKCTFNIFLQLTRRKDHMIFWQKIAKKIIVGETLQSGADLGNMNVWSEFS